MTLIWSYCVHYTVLVLTSDLRWGCHHITDGHQFWRDFLQIVSKLPSGVDIPVESIETCDVSFKFTNEIHYLLINKLHSPSSSGVSSSRTGKWQTFSALDGEKETKIVQNSILDVSLFVDGIKVARLYFDQLCRRKCVIPSHSRLDKAAQSSFSFDVVLLKRIFPKLIFPKLLKTESWCVS